MHGAPDPRPEDLGEVPEAAARALERELGALLADAAPPPAVRAALLSRVEAMREAAEPERALRPRPAPARRKWARLVPVGLAAAAAALLALPWTRERATLAPSDAARDGAAPAGASTVADAADIDRSGRVDVWDAYLLARAVESDLGSLPAHDFDGDGAVTRKDAELVAQRAVEVMR